jgi:hypothetical protein
MGRSTVKPSCAAASQSRPSTQMNLLPCGRPRHHTSAAASWRPSAALRGWVSRRMAARWRAASLGGTSRQPSDRTWTFSKATCLSAPCRCPKRHSRAIALYISTRVTHHATIANCSAHNLTWPLASCSTQRGTSALASQNATVWINAPRFAHPGPPEFLRFPRPWPWAYQGTS